jgi:hypothetical protein
MSLLSRAPARTGEPASPAALPLPPELPAGLAHHPRVLLLIDMDAVSHGLACGTGFSRGSDQDVQRCLEVAHATARSLDPQARERFAASSKTAAHHLNVLTSSHNGTWSIRRGLGGADQVLLEELDALIKARMLATRPYRPRPAHPADLVLLVAADHGYAQEVRQLRLLGVPTWLLPPTRFVAASLYSSSCCVSFLGLERPGSHTQGQLTPRPAPLSPRSLRRRLI